MMGERKEIRVWLSPDIVLKLRVMKVKGNTYSSIVEEALREFLKKSGL